MSKPLKEDSLIRKILIHLGETSIELLKLGATVAFDPPSLLKGIPGDYPRSHFSKKISYLKKSKYFTFKNNKCYLTRWGRARIIKIVIRKRNEEKLKWDGKWRGISFDIPELDRRDRDFLRRELRQMGFKELQKSLWVSPCNFEKELKTLLKLWKKDFSGDIRFLIIDKIDNDSDLRKEFSLT